MGKKPGALVELFMGSGKKKAPPSTESSPDLGDGESDEYAEEEDGGDAHGAAFASFADAAGIPPERRSRAQAALKQFVYACTKGQDNEGV